MARILRFLANICVTIAVIAGVVAIVLFTSSNLKTLQLEFWPFPGALEAPLYLVAFAPFLVGALLGGLLVWSRTLRSGAERDLARAEARTLEKENAALVEQLASFAARLASQRCERKPPAKLSRYAHRRCE